MWMSGPEWLPNSLKWPKDIVVKPNKQTEAEAKRTKDIFAAAVDLTEDFDEALEKHAFRISAWVILQDCRSKKLNRVSGLVTTAETDKQVKWWTSVSKSDKV